MRTTLATTAGKSTHFVVTPMARTPGNMSADSSEIFSIVPLEMSEEAVDGVQQPNHSNDFISSSKINPTHSNKTMQDIRELNNTGSNSTGKQELYLSANFDKTFTLSNFTATKTAEAYLPVLHELNHSSAYIAIKPAGAKPKEILLPPIYGLNTTSNKNAGKVEVSVTVIVDYKDHIKIYFASPGVAEETNIRTGGVEVHNHDNHDHDNPDVYFENNASEAAIVGARSGKVNNAEEVRLNGASSRRDLANETTQEKSKKTNNPEAEKNATSKKDEKDSKLEASHPLKGVKKVKKKESKKLLSSPWILILTILILFVLACIILAVLEFNRRSAVPREQF